ncbi:MAG: hypothetical protein ACREMP_04805 [Candidatus Tyrphobacter sp.]
MARARTAERPQLKSWSQRPRRHNDPAAARATVRLNAQTVSALPLISEALQVATAAKNEALTARANLQMAHYLILLGRHGAAASFFERAENTRGMDNPDWYSVNLDQRAILFAAHGDRASAYRDFEAAAEIGKDLSEGY